MRAEFEAILGQVADAINNAPDGHIIAASERPVFDLFADIRQKPSVVQKPTAEG